MAAPAESGGIEDYRSLRDARVDLDLEAARGSGEGGRARGFAVCFWLYLSGPARPSSVLLHQMTAGADNKLPFLVLSEQNKLLLFPLLRLHREAPSLSSFYPWTDTTNLSSVNECPLEKWIHIGCEVTENVMRLHIDGSLVAEACLCSLSREPDNQDDAHQICLVGSNNMVESYLNNIQVLSVLGTIHEQYTKNPPSKLSIDFSCYDGIEVGDDGVWCIVGGKPSCRRNVILEVVLTNAFGEPANKDIQIVASLVYADTGVVVEKSRDDAEAPLLISCEGLEYPATSKPLPILRGRALFKLKISQLSSKCDNKLFRIYFSTLHVQKYPFLEASSRPIRCISRGRPIRPLGPGKRTNSSTMDEIHLVNNAQGFGRVGKVIGCSQSRDQSSVVHLHPSKFLKVEDDGTETHKTVSQTRKMVVEAQSVTRTDPAASDSDSMDARSSWSGSDRDEVETFSDAIIFRYCLEGTSQRSTFLRGAAASINVDDLITLANQVSLYSGCSHHRNQIIISKQLLEEAADTWSIISKNNERALWSSAVPEIMAKFMVIAHSTNRGLSEQDQEVLRVIAGCGDDLGRDEFDRLWNWLYPVAVSLSKDKINNLWCCTEPVWIEGLITKEEAENALRSSSELLKNPGTFVLRFPTTRSWPHPDAGSLVVTYVGFDNSIHHRLLSLDASDSRAGSLQDLLLQEPELLQLGRVDRLPTAMRN